MRLCFRLLRGTSQTIPVLRLPEVCFQAFSGLETNVKHPQLDGLMHLHSSILVHKPATNAANALLRFWNYGCLLNALLWHPCYRDGWNKEYVGFRIIHGNSEHKSATACICTSILNFTCTALLLHQEVNSPCSTTHEIPWVTQEIHGNTSFYRNSFPTSTPAWSAPPTGRSSDLRQAWPARRMNLDPSKQTLEEVNQDPCARILFTRTNLGVQAKVKSKVSKSFKHLRTHEHWTWLNTTLTSVQCSTSSYTCSMTWQWIGLWLLRISNYQKPMQRLLWTKTRF